MKMKTVDVVEWMNENDFEQSLLECEAKLSLGSRKYRK